jgi:hypothetical protein
LIAAMTAIQANAREPRRDGAFSVVMAGQYRGRIPVIETRRGAATIFPGIDASSPCAAREARPKAFVISAGAFEAPAGHAGT